MVCHTQNPVCQFDITLVTQAHKGEEVAQHFTSLEVSQPNLSSLVILLKNIVRRLQMDSPYNGGLSGIAIVEIVSVFLSHFPGQTIEVAIPGLCKWIASFEPRMMQVSAENAPRQDNTYALLWVPSPVDPGVNLTPNAWRFGELQTKMWQLAHNDDMLLDVLR